MPGPYAGHYLDGRTAARRRATIRLLGTLLQIDLDDGRTLTWPVAEVRLALDGQEVTTPCFIAPGGSQLLGAVALESLFLAVDPVAKRLIPVDGFVG